MKKTTICKNALATLLLLCATGLVYGQEMVREVVNLHDDYSLVRETDRGEWLVYNFNSGRSIFSLMTDTTSSAPQMYLYFPDGYTSLKINDFEIFQDTVYFCGGTWDKDEEDSYSVWGYFPLALFPNSPVFIEVDEFYRTYKKMAVFSIDSSMTGLHVVMTECVSNHQNAEIVKDAVRAAPNQFNIAEGIFISNQNPYLNISDIESTDKYVIFSRINMYDTSFLEKSSVCYVKKPTMAGVSIFTNTIYNHIIHTFGGRMTMLEKCMNDAFVLLSKNIFDFDVVAFAPMAGGHYGILGAVSFPQIFVSPGYCKDMRFDKTNKLLEILCQDSANNNGCNSWIFHLNPMHLNNGGSVYMHVFNGELLNSLDVLRSDPDCFIASGHNAGSSILFTYKYQFYDWGGCVQKLRNEIEKKEMSSREEECKLTIVWREAKLIPLDANPLKNPVNTKCGKQ